MKPIPDINMGVEGAAGRRPVPLAVASAVLLGALVAALLGGGPSAGEQPAQTPEQGGATVQGDGRTAEAASTGPAPTALAKPAAAKPVAAKPATMTRPLATAPATAAVATDPARSPSSAMVVPARSGAASAAAPAGSAGQAVQAAIPVSAPAPIQSATPQPTPAPALSFTDDDLDKYHKPKPADEEQGEEMEGGAAGVAPGSATGPALPGTAASAATAPASTGPAGATGKNTTRPRPGPAPGGVVPEHVPLVRTPMNIAAPPGSDPLKESRDKEARDKFRAGQLQALRDKIAPLQARLDYLNARRAAVLNPLQVPPSPQTDDDKNREATLKPKDLLDQIDAEIASVQSDLKTAQDDLVALETRYGGAQ